MFSVKKIIASRHFIYFEYLVVSLLILWPLLRPGYIFAPDMPWPVHLPFPNELNQYFIKDVIFWSLYKIFPSWLIQKIVLLCVIYLAGVGAHKLFETKNNLIRYFCGLLYLLNPFFYSRLLMGQIFFCLGYALMPFLLHHLIKFFRTPQLKNGLRTALYLLLISLFSLPHIFFSFLFICILGASFSIKYLISKEYLSLRKVILGGLIILALFLATNCFWLYNFAAGNITQSKDIASFTEFDQILFKTDAGGTNIFFNILSMYGFWGDRHNLYVLPKNLDPFWWLVSIIFLLLSLWGILSNFKYRKRVPETISLTIVLSISVILSIGIAFEPFASLILWLNGHLPFYKGFREPQKFVSLIVISLCYFCVSGLEGINEKLEKVKKSNLIGFFLILIIIYNPLSFNGFRGQMFLSKYPASWQTVNEILKNDQAEFKVLFFPWHMYMSYGFAKNKIVGPISQYYFERSIIRSDNMELAGTYIPTNSPISQFIEKEILSKSNAISNTGEILETMDIKYIILAKEVDWQNYSFLDKQNDLKIVFDSAEIKLYENETFQ